MIDPNTAMLTWLKSSPDLAALVGDKIYSPVLPEGFSAQDGSKAIVVRGRGGSRHPEIQDLIMPSFAIEAWALDSLDARQIYNIISDLVHGATSVDLGAAGFVILAQEEVFGQDIIDPTTHWAYRFGYFLVEMRGGEQPLSDLLPPALITYPFHYVAQDGTNAQSVQNAPRVIRGYRAFNNAGYPVFVKLHDTATTPIAGSDVKYAIGVQSGKSAAEFPISLWFATGIGMTIVKGIQDDDATAIAANDCVVDLLYE